MSVQHPALRGFVPVYWRGGLPKVTLGALRFDQSGYFDVGDPSYDANVVDAAYTPNEGGVWVPGEIGLPRVVSAGGGVGARVWGNLAKNSGTPDGTFWRQTNGFTYIGPAVIDGVPCFEWEVAGSPSNGMDQLYSSPAGQFIGMALIRGKDGPVTFRFGGDGNAATWSDDITWLDTAWQMRSAPFARDASGPYGLMLRNGTGASPAFRFYVAWFFEQNVTYSVDQSTPGEYIPTGTTPSYRMANFYNPQSVDGTGLVTKGPHVPITDPRRLATNRFSQTTDFDISPWGKSGGATVQNKNEVTYTGTADRITCQMGTFSSPGAAGFVFDEAIDPNLGTDIYRQFTLEGGEKISFRADIAEISGPGYRIRIYHDITGTLDMRLQAPLVGGGVAAIRIDNLYWDAGHEIHEFIPTDGASVSKVFPYDNSNFSVDGNGVVTEHPIQPSQYYPVAEFYTQRYVSATQLCAEPVDLTNPVWTKSGCTAALIGVGMDGALDGAVILTATGVDATCLYTHTATAADHTCAIWLERWSGNGVVEITANNGGSWVTASLDDGFRQSIATGNGANPVFGIRVRTAGDSVVVGVANLFAGTPDTVRGLPPVFDTSPIAAAGGGNWANSVLGNPDVATLVTVEIRPNFPLERAVADVLLSTDEDLILGPSAGSEIASSDGTNLSKVAIPGTTLQTPQLLGVFFGEEGLQVRLNDSYGSLVPYNGGFSTGVLSLMEALAANAGERALLVTKGKDLAALNAAYDQLYEWFALELNSPLITDESGKVLTDDAGAIITL